MRQTTNKRYRQILILNPQRFTVRAGNSTSSRSGAARVILIRSLGGLQSTNRLFLANS